MTVPICSKRRVLAEQLRCRHSMKIIPGMRLTAGKLNISTGVDHESMTTAVDEQKYDSHPSGGLVPRT